MPTSPRAFFALSFLIVGIVNGFVINNGDIPVDGALGVSEIVQSDETEVAPSAAPLWDSVLVAELQRIIEEQEATGNDELLERISRKARPKPSGLRGQVNPPNGARFRPCYFNPISCFKK